MATNTTLKKKKHDGRSLDLTLQWLVNNHGKQWETWRYFADEWIDAHGTGTATKLEALYIFFEHYLCGTVPFTWDVVSLFEGKNGWYASTDELKRILLEKTNRGDNKATKERLNYAK